MMHYAHSCIVTLKANRVEADGTGSGIVIDTVQGLVVTHASLLGAIVLKDQHLQKLVLSQLENLTQEVGIHVDVEVILERSSKKRCKDSQEISLSRYQSALVSSSVANINPDLSTHTGSLVSLFKLDRFEKALKHFTPQSDWKFIDSSDEDDKFNKNISLKEKHDAEVITFKLLPYCILIKVDNWVPYQSTLSVRSPMHCHIGEAAEVCATPFGNLFPNVLVNSCSRGVISNLAGKNRCLILTDARCIPGSEGGPLYTFVDSSRYLTGMIVTSLCWKNSEWIGLSLACSIDDILESVATDVLVKPAQYMIPSVWKHTDFIGNISAMLENVPLIKVDNSWGSGVIVDPEKKLVLTCSHVIKHGRSRAVSIKPDPSAGLCRSEVVWRSPPTEQFDLAVLRFSSQEKCLASQVHPAVPTEGSVVYVVGHGVFGAEHNLPPSVTVGVVSKVITVNNIPVMIQTTCAVHPGTSGGGLIDRNGHLLGIVVCNTKDESSGACFPHINMSIPMVTIWPVIQEYCRTGDVTVLNNLHLKNKSVDNMWTLGNETCVNKVISRL